MEILTALENATGQSNTSMISLHIPADGNL